LQARKGYLPEFIIEKAPSLSSVKLRVETNGNFFMLKTGMFFPTGERVK